VPRDRRHPADHHDEQLAARELLEIRPDQQRRLDHADEHVRGSRDCNCTADAQRPFEEPCERAHDARQDSPVGEQRGERTHQHDQRQEAEREHDTRRTAHLLEWQRTATEEAEDECAARFGRTLQSRDDVIESGEQLAHARHLEQHDREHDLDGDAGRREAPGDGAAVLAQQPGDEGNREQPERALQVRCHGAAA
jgi:hypothetical protein